MNNFSSKKNTIDFSRPDQPGTLAYLTQNGMTFVEVENLLKETTHTSYPVVVSREQPYMVGQVLRRDLQIVLSMREF